MNKYHMLEHIISMGLFQISVGIGTHTAAGNRTVLVFIKNKTSSIPLHVPCYIPFHFPLHVPISVFHCMFHSISRSIFHCLFQFQCSIAAVIYLPFPSHLGNYFNKIGKISAKIPEIGKIKAIYGLRMTPI